MYKIFETQNFTKSMRQDFGGQQKRIKKKLREYVYLQLMESPEFGPNIKRLRNWVPPTWRYRIGAYRFFYEIDKHDNIVYMIFADHRDRAYKK